MTDSSFLPARATAHRALTSAISVPAVIAGAGEKAGRRFVEFFTANIRNKNTRAAYARAVMEFMNWCEKHGRGLEDIDPVFVAAYVELLLKDGRSKPTVKQYLAAIDRKSTRLNSSH